MSQILATMDIQRAKDKSGKEIIPDFEFTSGFARSVFSINPDANRANRDGLHSFSHPKAFHCEIRPRSRKAINLISQMNIGNEFVEIPVIAS